MAQKMFNTNPSSHLSLKIGSLRVALAKKTHLKRTSKIKVCNVRIERKNVDMVPIFLIFSQK